MFCRETLRKEDPGLQGSQGRPCRSVKPGTDEAQRPGQQRLPWSVVGPDSDAKAQAAPGNAGDISWLCQAGGSGLMRRDQVSPWVFVPVQESSVRCF